MEKKSWSKIDSMQLNHVCMSGKLCSYGVRQVWICTLPLSNPIVKKEVEEHLEFLQYYIQESWLLDAENGILSTVSLKLVPEEDININVILSPLRFYLKTESYLRFFFFKEDISFHSRNKLSEEQRKKIFYQLGKPLTLTMEYQCRMLQTDREIQRAYSGSQELLKFSHKGGETGSFTFLQVEGNLKKWQETFPYKKMTFSAIVGVPILSIQVEPEKIQEFLKYYNRKNERNFFVLVPDKGLTVLTSEHTFPFIVGRDKMIFFLLSYQYTPYVQFFSRKNK